MRTAEKYKEIRHGDVYYPRKAKSPLKAIKFFCRECQGMDRRKKSHVENVELVRDCVDPMCPLFDFRLGKNPFYKRNLTKEQKKAVVARLDLARGPLNNLDAQDENQRQAVSRRGKKFRVFVSS